jgi:hypothetical protein
MASIVLIAAYADSAAAQAPLWTSLADTAATAKAATLGGKTPPRR